MKKTKIFTIINEHDEQLKEAAQILQKDGTVAFPTETVYGLGANALSEAAVEKIFAAKGRPSDNPLIAHIASEEQVDQLVQNISDEARKLMHVFWPGPLTMIFENKGMVARNVTAGLTTLALRMPSHEIARKIIELSGLPIAAPSANLSGKPSPTEGKHVVEDLSGRVDGIVIAAQSEFGLESTILDMTSTPPMLLRPGSVTIEDIESVIGPIQLDPALEKKLSDHLQPKAPGMKYTHYSPDADVQIVMGQQKKVIDKINELIQLNPDKKIGVMCCDESKAHYTGASIISLGVKSDLTQIASNLFKTLRAFDELGVDIVFAEGYDTLGMGKAIMNRLNKAAGYHITKV